MSIRVKICVPDTGRMFWPEYLEGRDKVARIRILSDQPVPTVEICFQNGDSTSYVGMPFIALGYVDEELSENKK